MLTNSAQVIALEALIGASPIRVTTVNRGNVRKWCRAVGIASAVVEKLTTAELADAYNTTEGLATLLTRTPPPKARPSAGLGIDMDKLNDMIRLAVSDVLAELRAVQGEPMTENRVRELILEAVKGKVR